MSLVKECPPSSTSVHHLHYDATVTAKGKRKMCDSELPPPSTPPNSTPHFHLSSPETSTQYSPRLLQRMQTDTCFRCGQQGHWVRDCPSSPQNLKQGVPKAENLAITKIYCRCGHGFCEVRKVKSDRNFGRSFYVCPIKRGKKCTDFVGWCDGNVDESDLRPPPYKYPMCPCGAGVCRKVKVTSGENDDRYFFACPVGAGHGACKFQLWEEDALLGKLNNAPLQPGSQRTLHDYWDKESKRLDGDDLGMDSDSPSKRMRFIGDSELIDGEENDLNKTPIEGRDHAELSSPPDRCLDFPEVEADLGDIDIMSSVSWEAVEETARSLINLSTASRVHVRQIEFQNQISTSTNADSSFDPCPLGWLGRLVFFDPTLSLKFPQSVPIFCCVFPSFDAIIVPMQGINHDDLSGVSNHLVVSNPGEHAQLPAGFLSEVSRNVVSSNVSLGSERKPMSKEQRQKRIVLNALKGLLLELQSMNPLDHESMRKAAEDTFDLLATLPVDDYKEFSGHVWDFINSTSSVAEVRSSIQNGLSLEEHIQHYEEEKLRFADIHDNFVKTKSLLEESQQRSQSLREEAFRLKEMLQGVESRLTSNDMETKKMETHLGEINVSMLEAEESLKIASNQVVSARTLSQEIEAKQLAAKTALDKARLELEK